MNYKFLFIRNRCFFGICALLCAGLFACSGSAGSNSDSSDSRTAATGALIYSTTLFSESAWNDGSIANALFVMLDGDTFAQQTTLSSALSAQNLPEGLTASASRISDTIIAIELNGAATSHTDPNDISNMSLSFADAAFATLDSASVSDSSVTGIGIDFIDSQPVLNADRFNMLPISGTETIASGSGDFSQSDYDGNANYSTVSVSGQPFTEAVEVDIISEPVGDHRVNMTHVPSVALSQDDIVLVSFYARAASGSGRIRFLMQHNGDPWTKYVEWALEIGSDWEQYFIPISIDVWRARSAEIAVAPPSDGNDLTFGASEIRFRLCLGYYPQTLQLANLQITNYRDLVSGSDMPYSFTDTGADVIDIAATDSTQPSISRTPAILDDITAGSQYLPDFSYAGYRHSEVDIPSSLPGQVVIDVRSYGAVPDDSGDDTAAIKAALAAAHAEGNPVLLSFPAGRFIVSDLLNIRRNDIMVQGAGHDMSGTIFEIPIAMKDMTKPPMITAMESEIIASGRVTGHGDPYSPFSWLGGVIWIGSDAYVGGQTITTITSIATRGDHQVSVADSASLSVGQVIELRYSDNQTSNPLWDHIYNCIADDLPDGYGPSLPEEPETWQRLTIESIDGNLVTFKEHLLHDVRSGWTAQLRTKFLYENIGFEGFRIEFPETAYAGHHLEEGYNGIYLRDVYNGWVRNVEIINCDSGIIVGDSKNISVSDITLSGRGGHYTLMASDSDWVLFSDFVLNTRTCHNPSFNTYSRTCVYTHGSIYTPLIDQHNGMNYQNLLDDIRITGSVGHFWQHGGNRSRRPTHGAYNTSYNIRFHPAQQVPVRIKGIQDGPSAVLIGYSSDTPVMFRYGPDAITDGIGLMGLSVASLFEYQLGQRIGKTVTVSFQTDGTPAAKLFGETTQTVTHGQPCSHVYAYAPMGYRFVHWSVNGQSIGAVTALAYTQTSDTVTITANFAVE